MRDPWGDLNAPEATFEQLPFFFVKPAKIQQAYQNQICPKAL